jgi:DNA-binding NtrC family response regulator
MTVLTATSAEEALNILSHTEAHAVVSDQDMPGTSGVELLAQVRDHHPAIVRMMLTGYTAMDVAVEAINRGEIFRLVTKPWNDEELKTILRQSFDHFDLKHEIRRLNQVTRSQNFTLQDMNKSLETFRKSRGLRRPNRTEDETRDAVD